jgi:hypothetical protein
MTARRHARINLLTTGKAKLIFNIQSIIFYDILCICISTLPFRSIRSLITVYLILDLI